MTESQFETEFKKIHDDNGYSFPTVKQLLDHFKDWQPPTATISKEELIKKINAASYSIIGLFLNNGELEQIIQEAPAIAADKPEKVKVPKIVAEFIDIENKNGL